LNAGFIALTIVITAAGATAILILLLRDSMRRYALARPNARSSHTVPTPQGGGIAVLLGIAIATGLAALLQPALNIAFFPLGALLVIAALLAVVGAADDVASLAVGPRLLFQALAVAALIAILPSDMRIVPAMPWWLERCCIFITGLWFINLVNFMDGLDWIMVAEIVPVAAALAIFGMTGGLPMHATVLALALCGAMLGFAPFNRPVAQLFLGDVGSLPIGLLLGWLLVMLAGGGHLTAALLLPLYYLADATITLARRLIKREQVWQAHRSHFYQRAKDGGMPVYRIVGQVFAVNIVLATLAAATLMTSSWIWHALALAIGGLAIGGLLYNFSHRSPAERAPDRPPR
jgi:UDP-N-acetylmuramyl pentapeptide phosphotransferase/UDP-N-acetylglucosamine-1-phosphate transferase